MALTALTLKSMFLSAVYRNIGQSTVSCQQQSLSEPHYVTVRQRVTNKALAKREADTSRRSARFCSSTHLKRVYFELVNFSPFQQRQQTLRAFCEALRRWQKATGIL